MWGIENLIWNWISSWFTPAVVYGLTAAGLVLVLASSIARVIPVVGAYARLLTPIGFVLFTVGVYMSGGLGVQQIWMAKVAEVKAKLAEAEQKSQQQNAKLAAQIADKTAQIKETQRMIKDEIAKNSQQIDSQCTVTPDVVRLHNNSAGSL